MDKQNLIIFKNESLCKIFKELEENLNFNIFNISAENDLESKLANLSNYLIITQKELNGRNNQFLINKTPIKLSKLIEKINIEFLKLQFNNQSHVHVNNYTINLNSREMLINETKLKLTEKEINTIIYLSKLNKPVRIDELQEKVRDLKKEAFNLRFQKASGQLENTARERQVRRDIARVKTVLLERLSTKQ